MLGVAQWRISSAQQATYAQVARQTRVIADAALRYSIANNDGLKLTTGPTTPATVTMATLMAQGYLGANTPLTNALGQTYIVAITQSSAGMLQPIVASSGGQALPDGGVRAVARMITQFGGAGAFIAVAGSDTPGPTFAIGGSGVRILLSDYGLAPGPGHIVDAVFFDSQSAMTNTDTALHRVATAGHPEYTTMSTAVNMGANAITNASTIQANNNIGVAGFSPTAGIPAGWGGGVHTWDMYAEGGVGVGTGGSLGATITNNGEFISNGGWFRSTGNTGWYSQTYGGGIYMQDGNWVRVYNDKGLYTGGQVQAGSMVSNGRLEAKEFAQIDGLANVGWSCGPNGVLAQAADGSGMVQCKQGVWTLMQGLSDSQQVASPSSSCGFNTTPAYATCPTGYKISGGGYTINSYSPTPGNQASAPWGNQPSGNGWAVKAGFDAGNSCFAAYAICVR